MKKLPLDNSLYQQQHALARHKAGDQPKEGVSRHLHIIHYMKLAAFSCQVLTAPKPSQPPTPFAEGGKQLPGEVREEEREEGAMVVRSVVGEEKLVEATEQKNLAAEEDENEAVKEEQSERQEDGEMDLLKDIVAVFEAQCSDAAAKGDTPDIFDMKARSLEDALASPPDNRAGFPDALDGPPPDALDGPPRDALDGPPPDALDGPPQDALDGPPPNALDGPESPDIVSSPNAPWSEPDSLQTQVKIIIHSDTSPHHSLLSQNPPALIPSTFSPAGS